MVSKWRFVIISWRCSQWNRYPKQIYLFQASWANLRFGWKNPIFSHIFHWVAQPQLSLLVTLPYNSLEAKASFLRMVKLLWDDSDSALTLKMVKLVVPNLQIDWWVAFQRFACSVAVPNIHHPFSARLFVLAMFGAFIFSGAALEDSAGLHQSRCKET